jgi:hypothetical protein
MINIRKRERGEAAPVDFAAPLPRSPPRERPKADGAG